MRDADAKVATLRRAFAERFGRPCRVVARAPGRVNLIGEHTDYNDGLVLPLALEECTWAAAAPRGDGLAHAFSVTLGEDREWPARAWRAARAHDWSAYVAGVEMLLAEHGAAPPGFDLLIASDVPVGGGLASSAALELSTALALASLADRQLDPVELADLCRAAEQRYAGVPCGIMDQFVGALARADNALLLDCRSRTWRHIPLTLGGHAVVVIDSGLAHTLASGEYAIRRAQCDEAVARLAARAPGIRALRDVSVEALARRANELPPLVAARARHVVTEIERTRQAADAITAGHVAALGALLNASHRSLRDDFQVSTPQIDELVDAAAGAPGVCGARLTGAGFGGSIVAIAAADAIEELEERLRRTSTPVRGVRRCRAGEGAAIAYCAG
jgi:galactokinase